MTGPRCRGAVRSPPGGGERGSVPIEFALATGLLLLPVAVLVLTFPTWVERQSMARLAAQEAARTVAVASDPVTAAAAGHDLAELIASNHGAPGAITSVAYEGAPVRGGSVTAVVTVTVPLPDLPVFGGLPDATWTTRHTEPVDPYRSFP